MGDLRYPPAEPKRKEGQMRYKIEIMFDASRELLNEELSLLEDSLVLQILEPVDSDGNDCEWDGSNVRIDMQKEGVNV